MKNADNVYIERYFHADNFQSAQNISESEKYGISRKIETRQIKIIDALNETLDKSKRAERARRDWIAASKKFILWMIENKYKISFWSEIEKQTFSNYFDSMKNLTDNTKRLRFNPLKQTAKFMAERYDLQNKTQHIKIGNKPVNAPALIFIEDALSLYTFALESCPEYAPAILLMSLCGLRISECCRLSRDKINLSFGLIEISGKIKNQSSARVIPVPDIVLRSLKAHTENKNNFNIIPASGILFDITPGMYSEINFGKRINAIIKNWNNKIEWRAGDLRNCFFTFFEMANMRSGLVEQYAGHSARDISQRHYIPRLTSLSYGEKNALLEMMNKFRIAVTDHIDKQVEKVSQNLADFGKSRNSGNGLIAKY